MWFNDESAKPLVIKDKMNIDLVIHCVYKVTRYSVEPRDHIFMKVYGFLSRVKILVKI